MTALRLVPPLAAPTSVESLADLDNELAAIGDYLDYLATLDPEAPGVALQFSEASRAFESASERRARVRESIARAYEYAMWMALR